MYFQLFYTFSQTLNNSSSNLLKLTMKKNQLPKGQVEFQKQKKKKKEKNKTVHPGNICFHELRVSGFHNSHSFTQ